MKLAKVPLPPEAPLPGPGTKRPEIIAAGVVVDSRGRILLQEELMNNGEMMWVFPGGHIEFGETVAEAVRRELLEETGLRVWVGKFLGHFEAVFPKFGYHTVIFFHLAKSVSPAGKLSPEKGKKLEFFSRESALRLRLAGSARWALSLLPPLPEKGKYKRKRGKGV